MSSIASIDPRDGSVVETVAEQTSPAAMSEIVTASLAAFEAFRAEGRERRSELLRAWGDALEEKREEVISLTDRETALGQVRLGGELTRTIFQLRFFADVVDEGSYLEATIDHAGPTPMGPRPDLRRMLVPLGPVAVFGASNFPLAFSVAGGDTASAIAAGCPVIVKVHDSHPATSLLVAEILRASAASVGFPPGVIDLVFGFEAGKALVADPHIEAVGFTGSFRGGEALLGLVNSRPRPVPFYGELSGLNPLVILPNAVRERCEEIAVGLAGSFTASGGQFCTKPGLAFVPSGTDGDELLDGLRLQVMAGPSFVLLNSGIAEAYQSGRAALGELAGVTLEAQSETPQTESQVQTALLQIAARDLDASHLDEVFGPLALAIRYDSIVELLDVLAALPPSLTGTVHTGSGDEENTLAVAETLQRISGRVIFNGYPTGVAVSWSQHHGGPWPSTNSVHTSVGASAIRRFLRPVAWQDAPDEILPGELRDDTSGLVRRVDGALSMR